MALMLTAPYSFGPMVKLGGGPGLPQAMRRPF
jgi:hypothetical protein